MPTALSLQLDGKIALVVGATGNLGGKVAQGFAAAGADLVLASRTPASLESFAGEIRESTGRRAATCPVDLESKDSCLALAEDAWNAFGRIDVVFVSARPRGYVDTRAGTILSTKDEDWPWFLDTIVVNPILLIRDLARKIIDAGTGASIITVISDAGRHAVPGVDAYGIAKGALALATVYMAAEWGRAGIRVNAINPNGVLMGDDEESKEVLAENCRRFGAVNAIGRLGGGDEIVPATVFLASDASSYMTGQIVTLDGGMWLQSAVTTPPMYTESTTV
jgi:NAD(P)-dependent dehydrogenase (short-subunit alcohol dehydrogenase family)